MKLYYVPGACSLADLIVLEWTSTPYEAVHMNHETRRSPEFLEMNPAGAVPVLQDGGLTLTQNVAILGYVADLHPEARLLGDGTPRARAEVMRWLGFLNSDVHKAFGPIFTASTMIRTAVSVARKKRSAARHKTPRSPVTGYKGGQDGNNHHS